MWSIFKDGRERQGSKARMSTSTNETRVRGDSIIVLRVQSRKKSANMKCARERMISFSVVTMGPSNLGCVVYVECMAPHAVQVTEEAADRRTTIHGGIRRWRWEVRWQSREVKKQRPQYSLCLESLVTCSISLTYPSCESWKERKPTGHLIENESLRAAMLLNGR